MVQDISAPWSGLLNQRLILGPQQKHPFLLPLRANVIFLIIHQARPD
jgi:hypothetical protein